MTERPLKFGRGQRRCRSTWWQPRIMLYGRGVPEGLAILCLALAVSLITGCSAETRKNRHLERAQEFFSAGEYDKAKIEYLNLLRLDPQNKLAFQRLGMMWLDEGVAFRASPLLLKARDLAPDDALIRTQAGTALFQLGRLGEARQQALEALQRDSSHGEALVLLADTNRTREDLNLSQQYLDRSADHETVGYCVAAANLAVQAGDITSAQILLERSTKAHGDSPLPHLALANVFLIRKDRSGAEAELKRAAELSPVRSLARLRYAEIKAQNGDREGARKLLEELTVQTPDFVLAWCRRAQHSLESRRYDEALSLLQNVFTRDPQNLEGRTLEAETLLAKGDAKNAMERLERLDKSYQNVSGVKFQLARAYLQAGNSAQAQSALNQAVAAQPDFVDAILLLGEVDLRAGNGAAVISAMGQLLQRHPQLLPAEILLTEAYLSTGQLDEAVGVIRRQISASLGNADPYFRLGLVLRQQQKSEEAREAFQKVLELAPENLMALNQLHDLAIERQDFGAAQALVEQQMAKKPVSALAFFMQGKTFAVQGKTAEAELALREALRLDPDSRGTQDLLIAVCLKAQKFSEAIANLKMLLKADPRDVRTLTTLAEAYEQSGDFAQAAESYENLISVTPQSSSALHRLARIYLGRLNRLDRAFDLATKARTLQPIDPEVADTLGWILYRQGNFREALGLIVEAAERLPNNADVQFHLGLANYMMDDVEAARSAIKRCLSLTPSIATEEQARRWLAYLEDDVGSLKMLSEAELTELVRQRPGDVIARVRLGDLLSKKDVSAAAGHYEAALRQNPSLFKANLRLAELYAGPLHNLSKARDFAEKARELNDRDPRASHILGKVAFLMEKFDWAYPLLLEAARALPDDSVVLHDLGWSAYTVGRVSEACDYMRRALAIAKDHPGGAEMKEFLSFVQNDSQFASLPPESEIKAKLQQSPLYLPALFAAAKNDATKGRLDLAASEYERIIGHYPQFVPAYQALALVYIQRPRGLEKAYELAFQGRQLLPDDPTSASLLGEISYRLQNYAYARQLLQETLKKNGPRARDLYFLGMTFINEQQVDEGKDLLQKSIQSGLEEPLASEARHLLATLPSTSKG